MYRVEKRIVKYANNVIYYGVVAIICEILTTNDVLFFTNNSAMKLRETLDETELQQQSIHTEHEHMVTLQFQKK